MPKPFLSQSENLSLPTVLIETDNHIIINHIIDDVRNYFKGQPSLFPNLDQQALKSAFNRKWKGSTVEQKIRTELTAVFPHNKLIYLTGDMAQIKYGLASIQPDSNLQVFNNGAAVEQLIPEVLPEESITIAKLPKPVVSTNLLTQQGHGDLARLNQSLAK